MSLYDNYESFPGNNNTWGGTKSNWTTFAKKIRDGYKKEGYKTPTMKQIAKIYKSRKCGKKGFITSDFKHLCKNPKSTTSKKKKSKTTTKKYKRKCGMKQLATECDNVIEKLQNKLNNCKSNLNDCYSGLNALYTHQSQKQPIEIVELPEIMKQKKNVRFKDSNYPLEVYESGPTGSELYEEYKKDPYDVKGLIEAVKRENQELSGLGVFGGCAVCRGLGMYGGCTCCGMEGRGTFGGAVPAGLKRWINFAKNFRIDYKKEHNGKSPSMKTIANAYKSRTCGKKGYQSYTAREYCAPKKTICRGYTKALKSKSVYKAEKNRLRSLCKPKKKKGKGVFGGYMSE